MKKAIIPAMCCMFAGSILLLSGCGANSGNGSSAAQPGTASGGYQGQTWNGSSQGHSWNGRQRAGGGMQLSTFSTILKISQAKLSQDLKSGMSIAEVAQKEGISQKQLISAFDQQFQSRMQHNASTGRMSTTQVKSMESRMNKMVTSMIQHKGLFSPPSRSAANSGTSGPSGSN